jgi:hypothetical protein
MSTTHRVLLPKDNQVLTLVLGGNLLTFEDSVG